MNSIIRVRDCDPGLDAPHSTTIILTNLPGPPISAMNAEAMSSICGTR